MEDEKKTKRKKEKEGFFAPLLGSEKKKERANESADPSPHLKPELLHADMQAGIGPFLGVFLLAHGWESGLIGTVNDDWRHRRHDHDHAGPVR